MRQHEVEKDPLLAVEVRADDDLLHLGQLLAAKAFFGETLQELLPGRRCAPEARSSASSLKNSGSFPKSISMN